jgi:hypothetical protein
MDAKIACVAGQHRCSSVSAGLGLGLHFVILPDTRLCWQVVAAAWLCLVALGVSWLCIRALYSGVQVGHVRQLWRNVVCACLQELFVA